MLKLINQNMEPKVFPPIMGSFGNANFFNDSVFPWSDVALWTITVFCLSNFIVHGVAGLTR